MKKITRANFEGLRQRYPVLNKEEMRRYVGGNSTTLYDESDLALLNPYTLDLDINDCSAVGSDEDNEMEEDVWSSDLGVSAFSAGGYGSGGYSFYGGSGGSYGDDYGGYGWDIDYGYLDEVVIYGHKPDNNYYPDVSGYPGWNDSYGDGYWYSGGYSYETDGYYMDNPIIGRTDCVGQTIAFALGIDPAEVIAWLEGKYGKGGVPGDKYYEALSHFCKGSPTPVPPYHYQRFGENPGPTLLAAIKVPGGGGHSVYITEINGTSVTYADPQNGGGGTCSTLDIVYLYRVEGKK
ncbi:TIGR04149 family rSAM-modified RiPP [Bacteroides faecalis]|uniref:Uncharacterized protein n=1 Tax=Bacteroides faecalis TaxID=2447885 RepID=A0A401LWB9_9BACE|nr:TIGR04149 family rSAM-modified RiPP [Bacteroides faecalis]GCB35777.1 hypothetical protein KGMB02408_27220 [Bacteroides faecalis]